MSNVSAYPLFTAIRESGRLTDDQLVMVERAFLEVGDDAGQLADRLMSLGAVTKYQHRKIQLGRAVDLLFGHYLILERIGEGGMGKVYRAVELRLGRMVALKTIRPNLLANKTVISRYKREARAAGALEHPNIVKLYEAEDVDGRYYLAMEMVEGMDLSRLTKELQKDKRTILPAEAAEYIRQAALGLQHAHDKGLVHRDIKPSNLLVSGERAIPGTGGKATVKILDMGLVRSLTEDDATQVDLTRDGTVVGTPDYMSPEQAKNSSTVGPGADIYSLGCTLFYIIKGSPPYSDGTAIDKLIRHQLDPVPDIRQFRPDVPAGLAALIKRTMAKRPDERFASAAELAVELSMYTEDGIAFEANPGVVSHGFQFQELTPAGTPEPKAAPAASTVTAAVAGSTASASVPGAVIRTVRPLSAPPGSTASAGVPGTARPPKPASTAVPARPKVPVRPKPIAKPGADVSPSDSLPGTGEPKRAARNDTPVSTRRRPGRRARKKSEGFPVVPVAVAAAVVIALVVVAAVVFSRTPAPTNKSTGGSVTPPAEAAKATTPSPAVPAVKHAFRPVPELLPDQTAAVLVAAPKEFWERVQGDVPPAAHARKTADFLGKFFKFDPWKFDRVVVAFHADSRRCVAAAEGDPLAKPDQFRKEVDQLRRLTAEAGPVGVTLFKQGRPGNPFNGGRDVRAVLLDSPPAYLVGTDLDDLTEMFKSGVRKGPDKVSPKLLTAATAAGTSTTDGGPLLTFAASGDYHWPGQTGTTFRSAGVELLTLTARVADKKFQVEVTLSGLSAEELRLFARTLPKVVEDLVRGQNGKQLADAVRTAVTDATPTDTGGSPTLTLRFAWNWQAALIAADSLIPPPPSLSAAFDR